MSPRINTRGDYLSFIYFVVVLAVQIGWIAALAVVGVSNLLVALIVILTALIGGFVSASVYVGQMPSNELPGRKSYMGNVKVAAIIVVLVIPTFLINDLGLYRLIKVWLIRAVLLDCAALLLLMPVALERKRRQL